MLAVIKTGGKQYKVAPGTKIEIEKIEAQPGEEIIFSDVLLIEKDNKEVEIGKPLIEGAKVTGKILSQEKDDKVIIFKYKPKKRFQQKKGHRQLFTVVEISEIKG